MTLALLKTGSSTVGMTGTELLLLMAASIKSKFNFSPSGRLVDLFLIASVSCSKVGCLCGILMLEEALEMDDAKILEALKPLYFEALLRFRADVLEPNIEECVTLSRSSS